MKVKSNIISFLLGVAVTVLLGASSVFQFTLSPDVLYVDGVRIDAAMYKYEGSNYLPLRATAEALGADVAYNNGRIDITSKLTDIEAVAAKCKDSCVMVYVYKDGTLISNGSGFVYNGYIITAKHVTDEGDSFTVFPDGSTYGARAYLVPIDTDLDISVLEINYDLPSVTLGDSGELKEGEKVVAITSPKGVQNAIDECFYHGTVNYGNGNYLQISDSSIDSGSSGGAIFNTRGELVGVVIRRASQGNIAAIPINDLKPLLEQFE